ncbi:hypothetical protein E3N88_07751 [Mikania micrantha]|uniref:Uncharacterized protein n=1 Tax=Mikania micrantha TaxID=192012 RepID=A0A5N6PGJ2_9ASTR|nr:hypothetical protein E3N88_07751 [Mikania micrantha]
MDSTKHTCLKLQIPQPIFIKGTWFPSHFHLSVTDGLNAWTCNASEEEVKDRSCNWDQPVSEYIDMSERYLGFQQPGSVYGFTDAGGGFKRLSWTFEKEGTKLEWRWKFKPAENSKKTTAEILDFLMDANIRLSEEVVMKTKSNEKLKAAAEKSLEQSEKFQNEKAEFETKIYSKFLGVLNSKKAKLRELRDRLSSDHVKSRDDEQESSENTETYDGDSEDEEDVDDGLHGNWDQQTAFTPCYYSTPFITITIYIIRFEKLNTTDHLSDHLSDSSYFLGWEEYEKNPYHPINNPTGMILMGLAENQISFDLLESWLHDNPNSASFTAQSSFSFKEIALFQDYHGLPASKNALADFMSEIRENKVSFNPNNLVLNIC